MDAVKPLHRLQQVTHTAKVVQRCAKKWLLENGKMLNGAIFLKISESVDRFESDELNELTVFGVAYLNGVTVMGQKDVNRIHPL